VVRYALGLSNDLVVFGNDYPTPDGTCIRDYIHVTDLADAHLRALEKLDEVPIIRLNLGTGRGYSNLEVVQAVSRVAGKKLDPQIGPRRPGDPPELVADPSEAFRLLQWKPTRSDLEGVASEVVQWFKSHPEGYGD
jgi:UDP-glucose 4-epimerase